MTADEALELAKFQRRGVRLIVGATEAREAPIGPAPYGPVDWRDREPVTWRQYDQRKRLGFIPSAWADMFAMAYEHYAGREPTDAEYVWLHKTGAGGASLADAKAWLCAAYDAAQLPRMTAEREPDLLRQIPTLATVAEAKTFRAALPDQGEILSSGVYAALLAPIDLLHKRGMLE